MTRLNDRLSTRAVDGASLRVTVSRVLVSAGVVLAISSGALLSACSSNAKVEARTTTVGQELQDLETARNKGLLTEDEYEKQRAEIMKRK